MQKLIASARSSMMLPRLIAFFGGSSGSGSVNPSRRARAAVSTMRRDVTEKGEHGAMFFSEFETYVLPAYPTLKTIDPTGCGDAYRSGLIYGLLNDLDLVTRQDLEKLKKELEK